MPPPLTDSKTDIFLFFGKAIAYLYSAYYAHSYSYIYQAKGRSRDGRLPPLYTLRYITYRTQVSYMFIYNYLELVLSF